MNVLKIGFCIWLLALAAPKGWAQDDESEAAEAEQEQEEPAGPIRADDEEFVPTREIPAAEEVVFPVDI